MSAMVSESRRLFILESLSPMQLGPYTIEVPVMVAPMAGMTDLPFREICRSLGAGYAVGEMTTCQPQFRDSRKSATRWAAREESGLRVVQLLGADPAMMADASRYAVEAGAEVIDLNMGCPAKKVLQTECGSALMKNPLLIEEILTAVVAAVDVPVTLKIRTGWDREHRNVVEIARMAESVGIAMLTVHGRTRADAFRGEAEYDTIRSVKDAVKIPVIANGDIDSGEKARRVMQATGADGVMIGRACFGNPWIFGEVAAALGLRDTYVRADAAERARVILAHMAKHYEYYGSERGCVTFRKHLRYYLAPMPGGEAILQALYAEKNPAEHAGIVSDFFRSDSQTPEGVTTNLKAL